MFERSSWQSIDRKLTLLTTSIVLAAVGIVTATAYYQIQDVLMRRATNRLQVIGRILAPMITGSPQRQEALRQAANSPTIRGFLAGRVAAPAVASFLATTGRDEPRLLATVLVNASGKRVLEHRFRPDARPASLDSAVVATVRSSGRPVGVGPFEVVGAHLVNTLSAVVRESAGEDSPVIGHLIETHAITATGKAAITEMIGAHSTLLVGQPDAGVWVDLEQASSPPPAGFRNGETMRFEHSDRGPGIGAATAIPGTPWTLWLEQRKDDVLAPARTFLLEMIPLGLIIAALGALAAWQFGRRLSRPIVELTETAEHVAASGDTDTQRSESRDEIHRLGEAFERMQRRIAERESLEQQLRHSQKMEAVGRLAGGIAHDFNNLLTVILSSVDFMLEGAEKDKPGSQDLLEIRATARRAAALTSQLLIFSRKQVMQMKHIDPAGVLMGVETLLRRLLGGHIIVRLKTEPNLWFVKADAGQLEQVIVNLAVNARDAMPGGGTLSIEASNVTLYAPSRTTYGEIPPGEYIMISLADTGAGMSQETVSHLFEPFFTTKGPGEGTGLGLSTVQGIVGHCGGFIDVSTSPGEGAKFTVYLPRDHALDDAAGATASPSSGGRGQ